MTDIPHLGANLMKLAVLLLAIVAVIAAHRIRRLPLREHLALTKPPIGKAAMCIVIFVCYIKGLNLSLARGRLGALSIIEWYGRELRSHQAAAPFSELRVHVD
jgi:hypothetical protein